MNHDDLQTLMREATQLTRAGRMQEATAVLQRVMGGAPGASPQGRPAMPMQMPLHRPMAMPTYMPTPQRAPGAGAAPAFRPAPGAAPTPGDFVSGSHTHASLTRRYKLYTPPGPHREGRALVVMLHGCTQDPDDFAAGTGMNRLAAQEDFLVLYPAQAQNANPAACWNWFKSNHQRRGSGEPALLASMTQAVIKEHGADPRRVYIAGLSAGGAMAAVVGRAYPDVFRAVGVHSGLPCGAAHDAMSALAVMKSGMTEGRGGRHAGPPVDAATTPPAADPPTIVFHGDQDTTVHPRNAERVVEDVLGRARQHEAGAAAQGTDAPIVEQGMSDGGRRYIRTVHGQAHGRAQVEHWLLHGTGHAWSGGDASGTYTDPKGPDASREMWRFFSRVS